MSPVFAHTDIGPSSDENQDAFLAIDTTDGGRLLLVCDGMGGMGNGAEAARLAVERLELLLVGGGAQSTLRAALQETDKHLRKTLVDPGPGRPGTTAIVALVREDRATIGWAGDSRGMHIRNGRVLARTTDHKLVEELMAAGHLSRERANKSHLSHVVTRCLGGRKSEEEGVEPEVLPKPWALEPGDALVLCSDGLTDVVDEVEIASIVANATAEIASKALVQAALDAETHDNTTVLVYVHKSPQATAMAADTPTANAAELRQPDRPSRTAHPDVPTARPDPLLQVATQVPAATAPLVESEPDTLVDSEGNPGARGVFGSPILLAAFILSSLLFAGGAIVAMATFWAN
ncbi:MAG: PP2C family serine/threonine-protein phosphatase [Myxococcota bacterium]